MSDIDPKVLADIRRAGTTVFVHHSAVSREERQLAEERFHHGDDACIVCTSTLELGIDVGDLDRVLQAEAPDTEQRREGRGEEDHHCVDPPEVHQ